MCNDIVGNINDKPIWSFSQIIDLEGDGSMEMTVDCSIQAEVVNNQLILVVSPLKTGVLNDFNRERLKNTIRQEIWDKFNAAPSVLFYQKEKGLF